MQVDQTMVNGHPSKSNIYIRNSFFYFVKTYAYDSIEEGFEGFPK